MSDLFASSPEKIEGLVQAISASNAVRGWQGIFKELGYPTQDEQPIPKSVLDDLLKTKADELLADHPTQKGQKAAYTICDIRPSAAQIFQILYFKLRGSLRITQSVQRLFIERYSRTFGNFLFVLTNDDQDFSLCVGRAEKDYRRASDLQSSGNLTGKGGSQSQKPLIRFLKIGPKNLYRTGVEILSGMGLTAGAAPKAIADALWHALSVEKVTKEFYQFVEKHHAALKTELDHFKRIKGFEEDRARVQFATRLLGRMVFLRFISKKGIVPDSVFSVPTTPQNNYYRETLAPLFFDVLNTPTDERKKSLPPGLAAIPFLNGGLFEPHDQDGWPRPLYVLPNAWFTELADTFSRFNFTVAENTPWDQEVAVDPEMLGKIFENLLAAENAETGTTARKEKGAFYTPREIVDYLCRESLRARLGTLHPELKPPHLTWILDGDGKEPSWGSRSTGVPACDDVAHENTGENLPAGKRFYRRNLPHWEKEEAIYFITFRVAGSLPGALREKADHEIHSIQQRFEQQKRSPSEFEIERLKICERYLDEDHSNPILKDERLASLVRDALLFHHGKKYELLAWCIMPNHVHLLLKPGIQISALGSDKGAQASLPVIASTEQQAETPVPLSEILHSLKSYTANQAQKLGLVKGSLWQDESFDRWARNEEELEYYKTYIRQNPVAAGLVKSPEVYRWSGANLGGAQASLPVMFGKNPQAGTPVLRLPTKAEVIASLDALKIIDPAVGSGAFPIGMMHVLTGAYQKLDDRFDAYKVKERIIKNNLYGADIEPIAIELAKLRCWLSLIVESDSKKVQPLPNLDLKFFCVNTLLDPPPLTGNELLLAVEIKALEKLEQKFFEEHSSSKKVALRKQIGQALDNMYAEVRKQYVSKAIHTTPWEADFNSVNFVNSVKIRSNVKKKIKAAVGVASRYPDDPQLFSKWLETGSFALPFFPKELLCPDVFGNADPKGTMRDEFALINQAQKQQELSGSSNPQASPGFDIVVANPPYVRQEDIGDTKSQLVEKYGCGTGMADLYVYFYERGWQLLKDGGALAFISSNKFFRSGYGEKLRGFLTDRATLHQVIDFGDAPVFTAIAYPCMVILSKGAQASLPVTSSDKTQAETPVLQNNVQVLTWEPGPRVEDFASIFSVNSFHIAQKELTPNGWRLESPAVLRLLEKLRRAGKPLGEYVNGRFYYGIKTGLNEAFVVDRATRDRLIKEHKSSDEVLKPFLRGRDVKRWGVEFADQYLIKIESSENKKHPWSGKTEKEAEKVFAKAYPAIHAHFEKFRHGLIKRDDQGKYFWELRSCAYWEEFSNRKILYPDIYEHQSFAVDTDGFCCANTCYFISTNHTSLCGLLNSKVVEWFYSQTSNKVRGGYLRAFTDYMKLIPIPAALDSKQLEAQVKKILSAKSADFSSDVSTLESEIDDHVYHLYGLTKEGIKIIEEATP